ELGASQELIGGEDCISFELNGSNFVLTTFGNDQVNRHPIRLHVHKLDLFNLEINIAFVLVEFGQTILVIFEFVFLQHTRAGEKREKPATLCFQHAAQLLLGESMGAVENDVLNFDLRAFVNF